MGTSKKYNNKDNIVNLDSIKNNCSILIIKSKKFMLIVEIINSSIQLTELKKMLIQLMRQTM